jgi:predicted Rossmann fold nucleotide-binding protein DprA/Smf involved in DNA uptake
VEIQGSTEQSYWLALMYGSGVGLAQVKAIVQQWCLAENRPLSTLFDLSPQELARRFELDRAGAERILAAGEQVPGQATLIEQLQAGGIYVITRADRHYPRPLVHSLPLERQPFLLFCQGTPALLAQPAVAFIGSRHSTGAACDFAEKLAARLAGDGLNVIGGYARGVGQAAFRGAMESGEGQTTIVLPQGIGSFQRTADKLQDYLDGGRLLVISPFRPEAGWEERLAVARNKLITGLAHAVVVAASGKAGHAWDSANDAMAQGKPAFVWDVGVEVEPGATGNRALIEAGGRPVKDAEEAIFQVETVVEESVEGSESPPESAPHPPEEPPPLDAAATLDLLSRSGQVPEVLQERLLGHETAQDREDDQDHPQG